jgi:cytochrome b-561
MFPAKVSRASLAWKYSFWLGTGSAALFLLLILSGAPLLFLYVPSVERAYSSIKDIEFVVTFGSWLRSVHRVAAHAMVVVVALHLVRVFLTGAYKNGVGQGQKREWNWVIGVFMLLLTLLLSFTGYLLPWDQLAFWAVTVGTNIAASIPFVGPQVRELLIGGRAIDQPTLIRFYVLHIVVLPGALGALFAYHMWRIRKDGGLAAADKEALANERQEAPADFHQDLHPARRRPRHFSDDPGHGAQPARHHGERGSGSHPPRQPRHPGHHRHRLHHGHLSSVRPLKRRPIRSSLRTRRRLRGTSCGCRRS